MKRLVTLVAILGLGAAVAHADLRMSEPIAGSVLTEAPAEVVLRYSEALEVPFSTFKVYRLDVEIDLEADNALQRLNGLASELVNDVLGLRDDGQAEARVDVAVESDSVTTDLLQLTLNENLETGHYVVMWRVLSIDTHVIQGFFVFSVI